MFDKIFGLIGIHFPRNKQDIIHFSRRFLFFLLIIFVGSVVLFAVFAKFSTSPTFCGTCHIMKPFYNAWKTSTHNMVSCVNCHYPPGFAEKLQGKIAAISQVVKYVTRTYGTKPYAEIDDESCLMEGCHDRRLLQGEVTFKKGIIFDHKHHLTALRRGKKLKCTSCHSQIVMGSHIAVTEQVCFVCHFKDVDLNNLENLSPELKRMASCNECHDPPDGDIKVDGIIFNHEDYVRVNCLKCHNEVVQGNGEVPQDRCFSCHGEPEKLGKFSDDVFIHKNHVTLHKVECYQCHLEIKHEIKSELSVTILNCKNCHQNKHIGILNMYMGKTGRGLPESPSSMYTAQVDCVGCHIIEKGGYESFDFNGKTEIAGNISCITCHGNDYDGIVDIWKEDIETSLISANDNLKKIEAMLKTFIFKDEKEALEINRIMKDARFNIHFVKYSNGVHNPDYSINLLEVANSNLEKVSEIIQNK